MALPTNHNRDDSKKDTIYIDVDDEITTIIDKLQHAEQRIVALVLPKRASVLQSVVNMKLLKRSAENAHKNIVLITSEAGLLPLAGAVGLYVASNLQSKPLIPAAPILDGSTLAITAAGADVDADIEEFNPAAVADHSIGQLAGIDEAAGVSANHLSPLSNSVYSEPETIQLDDDDEAAAPVAATAGIAAVAADKAVKKRKNKSLNVPNFNKFRVGLILAILFIVLLGGGFAYANAVLPKATITISTNSSNVATNANLILDPSVKTIDLASATLPATIVSKQQTATQQVSTSGQKNNGSRANGTVMMSSQVCGSGVANASSPNSVPAGTGVSSGAKTFITQSSTTFPDTGTFKSGCVTYQANNSTDVTAQSAGADYNVAVTSFTVAGRNDVTAKSSNDFTGGTDNIVKVVTQADVDSATAKIASAANSDSGSSVKTSLSTSLQTSGYTAITASLHAASPVVTSSATVGDQADTVTVTQITNYTMYGAKAADIANIITTNVAKQIDPRQQQILSDGTTNAKYTVSTAVSSGPLQLSLSATSLAGPDLKTSTLASQLAGKKTGDVQTALKNIPGVTSVDIKYSPFWISSVPKKASRVNVVIIKAS